MRSLRHLILACVMAIAFAASAAAQVREQDPIGRFAADVRVAIPRFPEDPAIETALDVTEDNIPSRGLGLSFGAHVYPFRLGRVAVGVGAEFLVSRARRTFQPEGENQPEGPTVETRFSSFSPQVSLNFGSHRGWSYVSAGLGKASFTTELQDDPVTSASSKPRVLNYGGGARWFAQEHLAFTFDLRWYRIDAQEAITGRPAYGGRRMMVFSAGISLK